jgi:MinD-like ATPase involved in chromosome partitioning or flagellar assembly
VGELHSSAITGIRDPERESFIASTLFSQGWDITLRALDFENIVKICDTQISDKPTIILGTDLEGLNPAGIAKLRLLGFSIFLFAPEGAIESEFVGVQRFPETALELVSLMRGSLRAPLIRAEVKNSVIRARTIALSAASSSAGCTTVAINLAAELSLLGKECLLVDAHASAPAISSLLGQRGLRSGERYTRISQGLCGMEISQGTLESDLANLHNARSEFDFIVIDLGVVRQIATQLTSKRWESEALNWSATYADELWVVSRSDYLSLERLRELLRELSQNPVKPAITCIHNMRNTVKKNSPLDQSFLQSTQGLKLSNILTLPADLRSITRAESERSPLNEINERSHLRRSIEEIAGRLTK